MPIGVSAGLSGVATGTLGVRVTNGTNVYALSNNHVFAGVNTASIGDPIISAGRRRRRQRSRRPHRNARGVPDDRLQRRHQHHGRGDRAHVDGERRDCDARRRLRAAEPDHRQAVHRAGRAEVRPHDRAPAGNVAGTNVSVDVCYIAFGDFCLQEARFAGQISVSPGPFSAPGDSGSLDRHAGREPAGRASLRRAATA